MENKKEQDAQSEVQETPIDFNLNTEEVVEGESSQADTDTEEEVLDITKEAVSDIAEETDDSEPQGCMHARIRVQRYCQRDDSS